MFKALRNPADLDLLVNEAAVLTALSKQVGARGVRYLSELRDSFVTRDMSLVRRHVNVLGRLDGWHTFDAVRAKQPTLRLEHGVWMFNRILECLGHVHANDTLHGAVLPPHLLAYASTGVDSPWDHGVKLVDWSATPETSATCAAKPRSWLPARCHPRSHSGSTPTKAPSVLTADNLPEPIEHGLTVARHRLACRCQSETRKPWALLNC